MAKAQDAALAVKRLAVQFEGLIQAAAVLEEIGSAEGHLEELKAQVEAATKDTEKAKADNKKAKDALKATEAAANDVLMASRTQGDALVKAAQEQAAEIEKKAQDRAAAMVAQATMEQSRISAANEANMTKARAGLAEIDAARMAASAATDAKAKELADVEKALDKVRSKIAALMA